MARRNLLHKSLLNDFKTYLDQKGVKHRPGKGTYQVLQVHVCVAQGRNKAPAFMWSPIYEKDSSTEHYTVQEELVNTVRLFVDYRHRTPSTANLSATEPRPSSDWATAMQGKVRDSLSLSIKCSEIDGDAHKQMSIVFSDKDEAQEASGLITVFENGKLVNFQKRDSIFNVINADILSNTPDQKL